MAKSLLFFFLMVIANGPVFSADSPAESKVDLRVLIDVSGSMKRTDPDNLRSAALRLLVGILPETATSGIWTFGKFVNMAVPLGIVNSSWREKARKEADNIHSLGLFTNIEEALRLSTFDWNKPDSKVQRTIILLSDGMVDVSNDNTLNKLSRERIIKTILPRLKNADVTVHTVALSSDADHELMKTISVSTDGWYEKVEDTNNLQRVFLRLFEKSSQTDTLPLTDNVFGVDKSIEDMTLLVFRADKDKETRILTPGGKSFSNNEHPKNVKWHHEKGFDLITINDPEEGAWRMNSKIDPDNRVMVVTNLKLSTRKIENHILQGEEVLLSAKLIQKNEIIDDKKLLQHIDFNYRHTKPSDGSPDELQLEPLVDDGENTDQKTGDGEYNAKLKNMLKGKHQISIIAEGPTFKREAFFAVTVHNDPISAEIAQVDAAKGQVYQVSLVNQLRLKGLEIKSFVAKIEKETLAIEINEVNKSTWTFDLPKKYSGETLIIEYYARVKDRDKILFKIEKTIPGYIGKDGKLEQPVSDESEKTDAHALNEENKENKEESVSIKSDHESEIKELSNSMENDSGAAEVMPQDNKLIKKKKAIKKEKEEEKAEDKKEEKTEDKEGEKEGVRWVLIVAIALVVNALLGLIGVGAYFLWKKRRDKLAPVEEAEVTYE